MRTCGLQQPRLGSPCRDIAECRFGWISDSFCLRGLQQSVQGLGVTRVTVATFADLGIGIDCMQAGAFVYDDNK
jgi:hypothetical protein